MNIREAVRHLVEQDLRSTELGQILEIRKFNPLAIKPSKDDAPGNPERVTMSVEDENVNHAMFAWRIGGVHTKNTDHYWASGKKVALIGVSYVDFADSRARTDPDGSLDPAFVRVQRFFDWATLHAQIGIFPGRQIRQHEQTTGEP
jgi:hypothetical protein